MADPLADRWDVAVVGAGVAGAVAALRLARRDLKVLLVDKADWPRDKVCGGCVNTAALHALAAAGLADIAAIGQPYAEMQLAAGGVQARFPLPAGRAVSRRQLDAKLVDAAIAAGVEFRPATNVALGKANADGRLIELRCGDERTIVNAKLVLACDGLKSRLLERVLQPVRRAPASRIGAGALLDNAPAAYAPGIIHMACAEHGYVGLVRVDDNRLNIGAALEPAWVKGIGGPAAAIGNILAAAGLPPLPGLVEAHWRGTPHLTRSHDLLGAERLLALGDAAGYVEPFTGEGMAWAVAGAAAVEPFALAAVADWRDSLAWAWTAEHRRLIHNRQRACRGVASLLRRPRAVQSAIRLAAAAPIVAAPLTAWLNRDFQATTGKQ
ncbi:MAG TPA: FAD-dependent oxidoreductase [Gammaproteobacteria bacterium]|nr:FAD-dependent oxidoreductase [Gammaproteobacteria bacterium]